MPQWAAGLASGLTQQGDDVWIAQGPLGSVEVRFLPANDMGVIDHIVTLPDGREVYNALRITPNGTGCEVMFTLLRLAGMSDEEYDKDAQMVQEDLATLGKILEGRSGFSNACTRETSS